MTTDWKSEIARIVYWKQIAADHDKKKALPWHLPRVGAKPENIASAEKIIGTSFSHQFKEFLGYADGWQGFHVLTDLFGTKEFIDGKSNLVLKRPELAAFLDTNNLSDAEVISIGASDFDLDVFLHFSPSSKMLPGGVLWFANEEVDRYESFAEFFTAMVNYNARIAQKMAENA
ncbi:SMI1/KNR4 family protein [Collimonas humicola]|uniref:SMI1/KNR4 family protein n=1 Tax=Collimonas humicola TaxID=2825886 RepID=UPI001B8C9CDB|nr:SMI1/KNR4 family protein [Collimonas humicola]